VFVRWPEIGQFLGNEVGKLSLSKDKDWRLNVRRIYFILISSILVTFLIPSPSISERGIKGNGNDIVRDGRFISGK
jgi:hypothetical protein